MITLMEYSYMVLYLSNNVDFQSRPSDSPYTACVVYVSAVSREISITSSVMMGLSLLNFDAEWRVEKEVLIIASGYF